MPEALPTKINKAMAKEICIKKKALRFSLHPGLLVLVFYLN